MTSPQLGPPFPVRCYGAAAITALNAAAWLSSANEKFVASTATGAAVSVVFAGATCVTTKFEKSVCAAAGGGDAATGAFWP